MLGRQHTVAALQEWKKDRAGLGLDELPCLKEVGCTVLRQAMPVHQRQLVAGKHQLAQETINPLKLHEKLFLFQKDNNPQGFSLEQRVMAGIQKSAAARTENQVQSPACVPVVRVAALPGMGCMREGQKGTYGNAPVT